MKYFLILQIQEEHSKDLSRVIEEVEIGEPIETEKEARERFTLIIDALEAAEDELAETFKERS